MYVPGREQPQNPEDTGHGTGQGAKNRHRFVPRAAFREGEGRPRGQHTPHNRERTVQQAQSDTAGRHGRQTRQADTAGRHGTTGRHGRHDRHGTVRHSTAQQADTTGRAGRASTAQQAGRLDTVRQRSPAGLSSDRFRLHRFPDFPLPVSFRRAAETGDKSPEERTAVGETRFVNDFVDREFRGNQ